MPDVVTFGEAMIRLSPPHFQRLEQATTLDIQVGGGEQVAHKYAHFAFLCGFSPLRPGRAGRLWPTAPAA